MSKRMYLDGKECRRVVFHPYVPAMVNQVENWLTAMSIDGWKLVDNKGWHFYFLKSREEERKYFIYSGFDSTQGITYDFYRAMDMYSKSKSKLFKRTYSIFEVDPNKIDDDFLIYRMLRNKFYRKHYIKMTFFCLLFITLSLICSFYTPFWGGVGMPFMLMLIYAVASAINLSRFIVQ